MASHSRGSVAAIEEAAVRPEEDTHYLPVKYIPTTFTLHHLEQVMNMFPIDRSPHVRTVLDACVSLAHLFQHACLCPHVFAGRDIGIEAHPSRARPGVADHVAYPDVLIPAVLKDLGVLHGFALRAAQPRVQVVPVGVFPASSVAELVRS